jgi:hypothetical protein
LRKEAGRLKERQSSSDMGDQGLDMMDLVEGIALDMKAGQVSE